MTQERKSEIVSKMVSVTDQLVKGFNIPGDSKFNSAYIQLMSLECLNHTKCLGERLIDTLSEKRDTRGLLELAIDKNRFEALLYAAFILSAYAYGFKYDLIPIPEIKVPE